MENKQESRTAIACCVGGTFGGIGHNAYNRTYNPTSLQGSIGTDALSGLIAAFIGITLFSMRFKKSFSTTQYLALAMACGLGFHSIFGGIKSIVTSQIRINELQVQVATEQKEAIINNRAIAELTEDQDVKQRAIENIAEVSDRSEEKDISINAIEDIAESEDDETKRAAIQELNKIADNAEGDQAVAESVEDAIKIVQEKEESIK